MFHSSPETLVIFAKYIFLDVLLFSTAQQHDAGLKDYPLKIVSSFNKKRKRTLSHKPIFSLSLLYFIPQQQRNKEKYRLNNLNPALVSLNNQ